MGHHPVTSTVVQSPTFGNALDALRAMEVAVARMPDLEWREMLDALGVLDRYVYARATSTELHERFNRGLRVVEDGDPS